MILIVPSTLAAVDRPMVAVISWTGGVLQVGVLALIGRFLIPAGRVRWPFRAAASLLGATFAFGVAVQVNQGSTIIAPFAEEALKLVCVGVVLWMLRPALRGPLGGFAAGYFVGLGFEVIENVIYVYNAGIEGGDQDAIGMVVTRFLNGFGLHNMFTAISGAALAVVFIRGVSRWWVGVAGFVVAVGLHLAWDNLLGLFPAATIVLYTAVLACFAFVRWFVARRERHGDGAKVRA